MDQKPIGVIFAEELYLAKNAGRVGIAALHGQIKIAPLQKLPRLRP
jgi:hypothetical protein